MLWVLWLLFLHVLCVGLCSIKVAGNQTCIIFVVICLLLVSGREIRSPKLNVRGFNHWMGQILSIKEEWFIALRDLPSLRKMKCCTQFHVACCKSFRNNSPRWSLPAFSFAAFLTAALCANVLYWSLPNSSLSYAQYKMKMCLQAGSVDPADSYLQAASQQTLFSEGSFNFCSSC